jgi:hypothetical protein
MPRKKKQAELFDLDQLVRDAKNGINHAADAMTGLLEADNEGDEWQLKVIDLLNQCSSILFMETVIRSEPPHGA